MSRRDARRLRVESLERRLMLHGQADAGFETFENDGALQDYLIEQALERYKSDFGRTTVTPYDPRHPIWPLAYATGASNEARDEVSDTTNVQVAGIDEGDLIETDGRYLYTLNHRSLTVVDIQDPAAPKVVDRLEFEESVVEQYLTDDRLTVITQAFGFGYPTHPFGVATDALIAPYPQWSTFNINTYDVSNPANLELISQATIGGSLVNSRVFDGQLMIVSSSEFEIEGPQLSCEQIEPETNDENEAAEGESIVRTPSTQFRCTFETQEAYLERLERDSVLAELPQFVHRQGDVITESILTEADHTYVPRNDGYFQLTSVTFLDIEDGEKLDSISIPDTWSSTLYVSPEAAYLSNGFSKVTEIKKISWDEGLELAAIGEVEGYIADSFAMDEHNGHLRVATTQWTDGPVNNVFVLGEEGQELVIVGAVTDLAQGERIFATRFDGDMGYVVTFRQVDPLFTIDLSTPEDPIVLGELKIPGFSDYLHPVSENLLVGIGQDIDESSGRRVGPLLSLFDVSNPTEPLSADRVTITERANGWSAASYDHHAITIQDSYIAFPIQSYDKGSLYELWVFQLSESTTGTTLEHVGTIEHKTQISRSVIVGETLFAVSQNELSAHPLSNLDDETRTFLGPVARNDHYVVAFNDTTELDVVANDGTLGLYSQRGVDRITVPNDAVKVVEVMPAESGAHVTINTNGTISYTPPGNFRGHDTFRYRVETDQGQSDIATVHLSVMPIVAEDSGSIAVDVVNNRKFEDVEKPVVLSANIVGGEGTVSISDSGQHVVVTPAEDFNGTIEVEYRVGGHDHEGNLHAITERMPVRVTPTNDPPNAVNDNYEFDFLLPQRELRVLSNDNSDPDGPELLTIVEVGPSSEGAAISIAEGGRHLIYEAGPTPGTDTFTYTIQDAGGKKSTATVTVTPIDRPDKVAVHLTATDADGNKVSEVQLGESVWIQVAAEDLREEALGVFALFIDIEFDPSLEASELVFDDAFPNVTNGEIGKGEIDEAGSAAASFVPIGPGPHDVFRFEVKPTTGGSFTFAANPADVRPNHEVLVYGEDIAVSPSAVAYGTTTIEVVDNWQNEQNPFDVNDDGITAPNDALVIINMLNQVGSGAIPTVLARSAELRAEGEPSVYLDVNGDSKLSPVDALYIINWLNQRVTSGSDAEGEQVDPIWQTAASELPTTELVTSNAVGSSAAFTNNADNYYAEIENDEFSFFD